MIVKLITISNFFYLGISESGTLYVYVTLNGLSLSNKEPDDPSIIFPVELKFPLSNSIVATPLCTLAIFSCCKSLYAFNVK